MNCPNCGKQIPESSKVCGYCGTRLRLSSQPPVPVPPTPASEAVAWKISNDRLVLTVILVAVGWGIGEYLIDSMWWSHVDGWGIPLLLLINGCFYGLATGMVLWWAMPSIQWKGAVAITLAWTLSGYLYGWWLETYSVELFSVNWLFVRSICALLAGIAVGWVLLMEKKPLPIVPVILITVSWGFARGFGGWIAGLLEAEVVTDWIISEGITGALGVLLTLMVARSMHGPEKR